MSAAMLGPTPNDRKNSRPVLGVRTGQKSARYERNATKMDMTSDMFENLAADENYLKQKYPTILNFYDKLPKCGIGLETMETLAMERLRFLRIVEKHSGSMKTDKWVTDLSADLRGQGLAAYLDFHSAKRGLANRARDHFSHFILRLAYCRTDELRRWFIAQELEAFRWRCMLYSDDFESFTRDNNLEFTQDVDFVTNNKPSLVAAMNSTAKSKNATIYTEETLPKFYKVKFTDALDLVRNRKVFLHMGYCYVPTSDLQHLLAFMFKSLLTQNVALTSKILPNLDEDDRLVKMLSELDKRYTGNDYSTDHAEVVRPDQIKPLNGRGAFPMCMRAMQNTLEKTHHLKYKARLQYGLFLKGIGLSLDDAIKFFRGEFTQSHVDADKFDKDYTYGIRYNYGKEGKKVNWAPWNCMRIIMESVGPGENHGCPYRHHDPEALRQMLVASGIESADTLNQITTAAKEGHYQKACSLQFKAAHKGQELSTGMTEHPNQFYQESVFGGPKGATVSSARAALQTERVNVYSKKN